MRVRTNIIGALSFMFMATGVILEAMDDGLKDSVVVAALPPEWTPRTDWLSVAAAGFFFSAGLLNMVREIDLWMTTVSERRERRDVQDRLGALTALIRGPITARDDSAATPLAVVFDGLTGVGDGIWMAWTRTIAGYF